MGGGASDIVPTRVEGVDGTGAGLDAMSRFVLDLVDGRSTPTDIADASMLEPAQVDSILTSLAKRGLVRYGDVATSANAAAPAPATEGAPAGTQRVDAVFAAIAQATHYEMLGFAPDADKAYFKRAYFVLSKEFHPDSSSLRKVPGIRPKLEAIFRRLTDAHDVISRPKRRDAYDQELARAKTNPFSRKLHPPIELPRTEPNEPESSEAREGTNAAAPAAPAPPTPPVVSAPLPPVASSPAMPVMTTPVPLASSARRPIVSPGPTGAAATPASVRRPQVPAPEPVVSRSPIPPSPSSPSIRMPAPASPTRLAVASPPGSHARPQPPVVSAPAAGASANLRTPGDPGARPAIVDPPPAPARDRAPTPPSVGTSLPTGPAGQTSTSADRQRSLLRALHGASQITGPIDQVVRYERQAKDAETAGDFKSAVSFLRVASQIAPEREDLRHKLAVADRRLAETEIPAQRAKADADEKAKRFEGAALAWSRVCLGAPTDAEAHIAAARCLVAAKLDLRQARDFAQKAVELVPSRVDYRLVLIRIFQEAGMRLNARREADAAAKLDPSNQLVKNLQRELE